MSTTKQVHEFYSRRLLLNTPIISGTSPLPATSHDSSLEAPYSGNNSFDANVVMVLSVLLCALICSLGLNSIIRCALRCSNLVANNSSQASGNSSSASANRGIKKKALKTFPIVNYSADLKLPGLDIECVICLSEFTAGEKVRLLPKCNHGFHVRCIDKWLSSHSSCPKCRHCLIETCHKIVGSSEPQQTIVTIPVPLEPEGLIRTYRGN
ncbi:RING-H2 finger protein ATL78-like [Euphorbia lathyris]|uniref:RING-H2 finger protein ATL78-like n=1 Tax=Euphorbia lathyris TaxID=212925 RepID=UPI003313A7E7